MSQSSGSRIGFVAARHGSNRVGELGLLYVLTLPRRSAARKSGKAIRTVGLRALYGRQEIDQVWD